MATDLLTQIGEAADFLRGRVKARPEVGIVLAPARRLRFRAGSRHGRAVSRHPALSRFDRREPRR
jgi:hypothetical protein